MRSKAIACGAYRWETKHIDINFPQVRVDLGNLDIFPAMIRRSSLWDLMLGPGPRCYRQGCSSILINTTEMKETDTSWNGFGDRQKPRREKHISKGSQHRSLKIEDARISSNP